MSMELPFDAVRQKHLYVGHEFEKFIRQEDILGDWGQVPTQRTQALTQVDKPLLPGRMNVPESINFHPL